VLFGARDGHGNRRNELFHPPEGSWSRVPSGKITVWVIKNKRAKRSSQGRLSALFGFGVTLWVTRSVKFHSLVLNSLGLGFG